MESRPSAIAVVYGSDTTTVARWMTGDPAQADRTTSRRLGVRIKTQHKGKSPGVKGRTSDAGGRLSNTKHLRLNLRVRFDDDHTWFHRTIVWAGLQIERTEATLFSGGHIVTWLHDVNARVFQCEVDGAAVRIEPGFWRWAKGRKDFLEVSQKMERGAVDAILLRAIAERATPALITPILQLVSLVRPRLDADLAKRLGLAGGRPDVVFLDDAPWTVGCSEETGCSAEYRRCEECDTELPPPDGSSTRGGGVEDPRLFNCTQGWLDDLTRCAEFYPDRPRPSCGTPDLPRGPLLDDGGTYEPSSVNDLRWLICLYLGRFNRAYCVGRAEESYWRCRDRFSRRPGG